MVDSLYKCPVCGLRLDLSGRSYCCINKHSFDLSKNGYINLVLANQKSSKSPGDSKEMLISRKEFLNKGLYRPLLEKLESLTKKFIEPVTGQQLNVLDLGCGEGYYICGLKALIENYSQNNFYYGIDVSKEAITLAAKRNCAVNFAVGNAFLIPFLEKSFNLIISVFSPIDNKEIKRVLKNNGLIITVGAGPGHLYQLVEQIYDKPLFHNRENSLFNDPDFEQFHREDLNFSLQLQDKDDIKNIFMMTPYFWQAPADKQQKILELSELNLNAEFKIEIFRKIF